MHHQTDSWLAGDWVVLGAYVPHWAIVIAGLIVVAILVAWFERHKRTAVRVSPRAAGRYDGSVLPQRSVSRTR
jgi:hypothetical protein